MDDSNRLIRGLAALPLVLVLALLLASCGPENSDSTSTTASTDQTPGSVTDPAVVPSIVSQEQIDAQEQGSAARALLDWWSAFQYAEDGVVVEMTAKPTLQETSESRLSKLVGAVGSNLQGIKIVGERVEGDQALVRTLLLTYALDEEGQVKEGSFSGTPRSFDMAEEGGEWKFNEPSYLDVLFTAREASSGN